MNSEERNIERIKRFRLTANVGDRTFYNGVEYVDLGLPSGTKWATMNVGAKSITDGGLYFQWGDAQGYTMVQIGNNFYDDSLNLINNRKNIKIIEDDAAHFHLGGNWRMPTKEEVVELITCTNRKYVEINGINGYVCVSKKNTNKWIFIPFGGFVESQTIVGIQTCSYLWSSSSGGGFRLALRINDFSCRLFASEWFRGNSCRGVFK